MKGVGRSRRWSRCAWRWRWSGGNEGDLEQITLVPTTQGPVLPQPHRRPVLLGVEPFRLLLKRILLCVVQPHLPVAAPDRQTSSIILHGEVVDTARRGPF